MDGDSKKQLDDLEKNLFKKPNNVVSNDGNVFQSIWIRYSVQTSTRLDKFLLDYGFNFLFGIGIISWIVFFITK